MVLYVLLADCRGVVCVASWVVCAVATGIVFRVEQGLHTTSTCYCNLQVVVKIHAVISQFTHLCNMKS